MKLCGEIILNVDVFIVLVKKINFIEIFIIELLDFFIYEVKVVEIGMY